MNDDIFKAALAGLLHDVGKFAQRAAEGLKIAWSYDENSDIKKRYRHQHALYTDQVVEQIVPDKWRQEVRAGAGHHHNPQTHLERVVALADHLSAGERADDTGKHPRQLQSIFCSITGLTDEDGKLISAPKEKYLPLKKLAIEQEVIFPVDTIDDSHGTYKELWDGFEDEALALKRAFAGDEADPTAYLESLLNLMQQYTWCIPSAYYNSVPDVSLYDHSRMTAALAACLVEQNDILVQDLLDALRQWHQEQKLAEKQGRNPDAIAPPSILAETDVALLVGGDISGVQRFIYTLSSSGAAKALRGRSFYLQLLTEAIAHYTLDQLGLPSTNLIYAGGGNFFLLTGVEQGKILHNIKTAVSEKLVKMHQGDLHLILSFIPISAREFDRRKFHQAWSRLHEKLNQAKLQPLISLGKTAFLEKVGAPLGEGGDDNNMCAISGQEIPSDKGVEFPSGGGTIRISDFSNSLIGLGNRLAKATHLVTVCSAPESIEEINSWEDGVRAFGYATLPVDATHNNFEKKEKLALPETIHRIELTTIKQAAKYSQNLSDRLAQTKAPIIQTFRSFAQLVPPDLDGNPLTFDELADQSKGGLKRWAVLRMDVDNLGKLFEQGFNRGVTGQEENNLTLSRMAQLSFSLRLFFEGWLPELGRLDEIGWYKNRLYLQYAGGDDLFVVGSWDALPEFAHTIRQSFTEFVSNHPGITLSGGITLAGKKYPLYQAAHNAEYAENLAKSFTRHAKREDNGPQQKDALTFLGQVVGWENFGTIAARAHQLEIWCGEDEELSKAVLQTLLSIYTEYKRGREQALKDGKWKPDQPYYGPWRWHLAYRLGRLINHNQDNISQEVKQTLQDLEKELLTGPEHIETIGLTARWAQYLVRKERSNT